MRYYEDNFGDALWRVCETLPYNRGSAIKHIARAGLKPGNTAIADLEKAEREIAREIMRLQEEADNDFDARMAE